MTIVIPAEFWRTASSYEATYAVGHLLCLIISRNEGIPYGEESIAWLRARGFVQ